MSTKYDKLVDNVLNITNELRDHSTLHLVSIAKAIEQKNRKINKIIFHGLSEDELGDMKPAILLTQELELLGCSEKSIFTCEHHIFYANSNGNEMKTRFAVAHELGHILLHNPLARDRGDRLIVQVPDSDRLFAVRYANEEEIEADIFAAVMCEQRKRPIRHPIFKKPCIKKLKEYAKNGYMRPELKDLLREVKTCSDIN